MFLKLHTEIISEIFLMRIVACGLRKTWWTIFHSKEQIWIYIWYLLQNWTTAIQLIWTS